MDILNEIFRVCIIPLLGVLTVRLVTYINSKNIEIKTKVDSDLEKKYLDMLAETITNCVLATNQTYVDALKEKNAFDAEAQKEAFRRTLESVKNVLSADALEYLSTTFGDINIYITQKIEAEVKNNKKDEN